MKEFEDGYVETKLITVGELQSSVFGPILYLLYIRTITKRNATLLALFADDRTFLTKGDNLEEAVTKTEGTENTTDN